jgi:hypothetical protein
MARHVSSPVRRRTGREEPPAVLVPSQPVRDTSSAADVIDSIDEVLADP